VLTANVYQDRLGTILLLASWREKVEKETSLQGVVGVEADRPDLIYTTTLRPTWPSYAALITAGLTTWPETW
jgi:hypothetical protein